METIYLAQKSFLVRRASPSFRKLCSINVMDLPDQPQRSAHYRTFEQRGKSLIQKWGWKGRQCMTLDDEESPSRTCRLRIVTTITELLGIFAPKETISFRKNYSALTWELLFVRRSSSRLQYCAIGMTTCEQSTCIMLPLAITTSSLSPWAPLRTPKIDSNEVIMISSSKTSRTSDCEIGYG